MRRSTRPAVESLEGKALLSGVVGQGLAASISTDHASYRRGQEVAITFTETNITSHDVTVAHGPGNSGFVATRGGREAWRSNAGIQAQFVVVEVVHPGRSITLRATWDGRSDLVTAGDPSHEGPPLAGSFTIRNQLDPEGPSATITIGVPHVTPPKPTGRVG